MEYVSPFDERRRAAEPLAPRPAELSGAAVALLDITKRRGDEFLDRIEELLNARGAQTLAAVKGVLQTRRPRDRAADRRPRRPRRRGACRLRVVHVVQCARHGRVGGRWGSPPRRWRPSRSSTRRSSRLACWGCPTTRMAISFSTRFSCSVLTSFGPTRIARSERSSTGSRGQGPLERTETVGIADRGTARHAVVVDRVLPPSRHKGGE